MNRNGSSRSVTRRMVARAKSVSSSAATTRGGATTVVVDDDIMPVLDREGAVCSAQTTPKRATHQAGVQGKVCGEWSIQYRESPVSSRRKNAQSHARHEYASAFHTRPARRSAPARARSPRRRENGVREIA